MICEVPYADISHLPEPSPIEGEGWAWGRYTCRWVNGAQYYAASVSLIDPDTMSRVLGNIEPTGVIDPHRDGAPEVLFGLKIRRVLSLGGDVRTGLDELLGGILRQLE